MDKADLRTQVASWLNRTDLTDAQLDLFITAAETDIRNDLYVRENEQATSGTVTANTFTAPADFLFARFVTVDDHVLEYLPPDQFAQREDAEWTGGFYTIRGTLFKVLGGTDYVLTYSAGIPSLVDDSDENWVLTTAPDLYIWACCKYGSVFLRDPAGAQGYGELYRSAALRLNALETKARFGGPMMVRLG